MIGTAAVAEALTWVTCQVLPRIICHDGLVTANPTAAWLAAHPQFTHALYLHFFVTWGGGILLAGHTRFSQVNPTARMHCSLFTLSRRQRRRL
jgi:hypothetical protein